MNITLDDVLTILDEHYNNVKALDTLNEELFQLRMADKETALDWGVQLLRHLQVLAASFPDPLSPDRVAELKRDHFYGGLPRQLKAMVAYLKAGHKVRTYSDYLRAAWEVEKEDSMELPKGPRTQTTDSPLKPQATSFFPPAETQGQPAPPQRPQQCIWHIWRKRMLGAIKMKRVIILVELKDSGTLINTIMPKYVNDHSLQMGPITNLLGAKVTCVGLGNAYMRPLGYVVIWVQVDRVQGYDKDQIALVIPDFSNFAAQIPVILGTPTTAASLM